MLPDGRCRSHRALPTQNGGISKDRLTVFHLRHGVWWNTALKREVVAGDVVRGMKFICNPVNPSGAPGYYLSTIVGMQEFCDAFGKVPGVVADLAHFVETHDLPGVRATDDYTVTMRLQAPAPDFLNLLAMPFASPIPIEYLNYLPMVRLPAAHDFQRSIPDHEVHAEPRDSS
jgi:peptide/nickel transport system substrate-binding protein